MDIIQRPGEEARDVQSVADEGKMRHFDFASFPINYDFMQILASLGGRDRTLEDEEWLDILPDVCDDVE